MQIKTLTLALAIVGFATACASTYPHDVSDRTTHQERQEAHIQKVLDEQEAAWNRGDIDGYMQSYWQSPDLRFASGGTVLRGWQATRDRYHARYSSRALMGQLSTPDLEIHLIGSNDAVVYGRWALARAGDHPSGLFTLIMHKFGDDWLIVSDTTTSAD